MWLEQRMNNNTIYLQRRITRFFHAKYGLSILKIQENTEIFFVNIAQT